MFEGCRVETRFNDHRPVKCKHCEWEGLKKDCVHTWGADCWGDRKPIKNYSRTGYTPQPGGGDVEGLDRCPICGADEPEIKEDK